MNAGGVAIGSDAEEPVAWAGGAQHQLYQVLDAFQVEVKDVTDAYYTMGWLIIDDRPIAFLQHPGGAIFPLTGDPSRSSAATDLNNVGIAAGAAGDGEGGADAALFVYGAVVPIESLLSAADDVAWNLNPLAVALNDDVWVVGNGRRGVEAPSGWLVRPPQ